LWLLNRNSVDHRILLERLDCIVPFLVNGALARGNLVRTDQIALVAAEPQRREAELSFAAAGAA
jgi:hypothetical protein